EMNSPELVPAIKAEAEALEAAYKALNNATNLRFSQGNEGSTNVQNATQPQTARQGTVSTPQEPIQQAANQPATETTTDQGTGSRTTEAGSGEPATTVAESSTPAVVEESSVDEVAIATSSEARTEVQNQSNETVSEQTQEAASQRS